MTSWRHRGKPLRALRRRWTTTRTPSCGVLTMSGAGSFSSEQFDPPQLSQLPIIDPIEGATESGERLTARTMAYLGEQLRA